MNMRFILLRGLGRDQLHWPPFLEALQAHWPSALIETPDLPGTGVLHRVKSPLSITDYIPHLERQLGDSLEPACLIGLSLGGMIGLHWAEQCPDKFLRIVTINSSCNLSPFYQRLKIYRAWRHPGAIFRWSKFAKERAVYQLTCNTRPVDEALIQDWAAIQRQRPVSFINQIRQVWSGFFFKSPDPDSVPPVSVVFSKADHLVAPDCSLRLQQKYGKSDYIHSWAGHDLPQDDPVWLADKIRLILS